MPLTAQQLSAGYRERDALHAVDCDIVPGTVSILIGPNGSGKSTLLRCLARGLRPRQGRVLLEESDLYSVPPRAVAAHLAYVPQNNPVNFSFTVRELVRLGAAASSRLSRAAERSLSIDERVAQALRALDLDTFAGRSLLTLSGGEQQRAAIARALAQDTPYLLLDEPTAHLDLRHQGRLLHLLRQEARTRSKAVLIVLHDVSLAAAWADRLILLHNGRIAASGDPAAVLTPETLESVYQTKVLIRSHPLGQGFWVSPAAAAPDTIGAHGEAVVRVHLLCGGGAGTPVMAALHAAGFPLSAGVLSPTDTDAQTASALKIPCTLEAPFSPLSPAALEADAKQRRAADCVVLAPFPIGPANLALLAAAAESAAAGQRLLMVSGGGDIGGRDFTGGEGQRQWESLRRLAYRQVDTAQELIDLLTGGLPKI